MIFGLLYFCVVILCVNRSRSSFILYRIVKRHSRQSNVRRIWTCADNAVQHEIGIFPPLVTSSGFESTSVILNLEQSRLVELSF